MLVYARYISQLEYRTGCQLIEELSLFNKGLHTQKYSYQTEQIRRESPEFIKDTIAFQPPSLNHPGRRPLPEQDAPRVTEEKVCTQVTTTVAGGGAPCHDGGGG